MISVSNPLAAVLGTNDPVDVNEQNAADRIGRRIRGIRLAKDLSQAELGQMVGLTADRVQKYENGARKPKAELLKQIAGALGVETLALTDPVVANYIGAMYGIFEMEDQYGLQVKREHGKLSLVFGDGINGTMNGYLDEWYGEHLEYESKLNAATTEQEREKAKLDYKQWEWTFPNAITERTEKRLREIQKAQIQEQIEQLQKKLSDLNEDGNDE